MGHRAYSRQPDGRFRRATLENTFGLSTPSCPDCGRLNPHAAGGPPPETCHACGMPMKPRGPLAPCFDALDDSELSALAIRLKTWDARAAEAGDERWADREFSAAVYEWRREMTWALSEVLTARDRLWGGSRRGRVGRGRADAAEG